MMAGIVQLVLTDHEQDVILKWADLADASTGTERERNLLAKLRAIRTSCDCEGGKCAVPRS